MDARTRQLARLAGQGDLTAARMLVRALERAGASFPTVKGTLTTDDEEYTVEFDATPWFRQAIKEEIEELEEIEWGGDYAADDIAWFCSDQDEEVSEALEYCEDQDVGFEVRIDEEQASVYADMFRLVNVLLGTV